MECVDKAAGEVFRSWVSGDPFCLVQKLAFNSVASRETSSGVNFTFYVYEQISIPVAHGHCPSSISTT
jgi:hypothetical protein